MSAARHFHAAGTFPGDLEADIKSDVAAFRANGNTERMNAALDELNDLRDGTWKPDHA
jgi:hypothetical protein